MTLLLYVLLSACGDKDSGSPGDGGADGGGADGGGSDGGAGDGGGGDGGGADGGGADGGGGDGGGADGGGSDGGGGADGGGSDGGGADGGGSDGGGADGGGGDGGDGDGGGEPEEGLLTFQGHGDIDEGWSGWEDVVLRDDLGLGDESCRIHTLLENVGPASGCAPCSFAYTVRFGSPEIVTDTHCAEVGWDAAKVATLEGQERSYGLALNYLGHANALMMDRDGVWTAVAYVTWDEAGGTIDYDWDQGYFEY